MFSCRNGEFMRLLTDVPTSGRFLGVMLKAAHFPPGPHDIKALKRVLIACEWADKWQWVYLDPESKEEIGGYMADNRCTLDVWYYLLFVDHVPKPFTLPV